MNWQIFSTIGYLGTALAVAAVALCLFHWKRPHRWFPAAALALAVAASLCARVNSTRHVNHIAIDPSAKIAELKELEDRKRQALIESRSDEVAEIQFAEDGQEESLDKAGMDEVDLKYLKAISEGDTPDWKNQKKERGSADAADDSLESLIGGVEESEGADVSSIEQANEAPEPILMSEAHVVLANRLDLWHLRLTQWLIWIAVAVMVLDYLRRANRYEEAWWPLPLPSRWLEAISATPEIHHRPQPPRRDTAEELAWLTRRGDAWIWFTDKADQVPNTRKALARLKRWPHQLDLLDTRNTSNSDFIFESLWYGRNSFIADDPTNHQARLDHFIRLLEQRRRTRARAAQDVHLVWDSDTPLAESTLAAFHRAAHGSGFSLFLLHDSSRSS